MLLTAKLFNKKESITQRIWYSLITCAHKQKTISYRDLLKDAGNSDYNMKDLFDSLTIIGNLEEKNNRPMINALAVSVGGLPGAGFFNWAKGVFDKKEMEKYTNEKIFELIKEDCYEFWSDDSRFLKFKDLVLF